MIDRQKRKNGRREPKDVQDGAKQHKTISTLFLVKEIMNSYVVYVHHNKINGKRYVGITNRPRKRWYGNGKAYQNCPHFAAAICKYGWDNFSHYFLDIGLTLEEASTLEQMYIARYRTTDKRYGYNIAEGGHNPPTMLGKHHSEETKSKMRAKAVGRTVSEAQKRKQSKAMQGKMVGEKNHKSTAVRCVTTGEVFVTQTAAAQAKGIEQSKICLCCQGKRNHTHGLQWEYVNKLEA